MGRKQTRKQTSTENEMKTTLRIILTATLLAACGTNHVEDASHGSAVDPRIVELQYGLEGKSYATAGHEYNTVLTFGRGTLDWQDPLAGYPGGTYTYFASDLHEITVRLTFEGTGETVTITTFQVARDLSSIVERQTGTVFHRQ